MWSRWSSCQDMAAGGGLGWLNLRGVGPGEEPALPSLSGWALPPHGSLPHHGPKPEPRPRASCVALPRSVAWPFMGPIPASFPTLGVGAGGPTQRQRAQEALSLSVHIPGLAQGVAQLGQGTAAPASSPVCPDPQTSAPVSTCP